MRISEEDRTSEEDSQPDGRGVACAYACWWDGDRGGRRKLLVLNET
jgi:hypothetical protein